MPWLAVLSRPLLARIDYLDNSRFLNNLPAMNDFWKKKKAAFSWDRYCAALAHSSCHTTALSGSAAMGGLAEERAARSDGAPREAPTPSGVSTSSADGASTKPQKNPESGVVP